MQHFWVNDTQYCPLFELISELNAAVTRGQKAALAHQGAAAEVSGGLLIRRSRPA